MYENFKSLHCRQSLGPAGNDGLLRHFDHFPTNFVGGFCGLFSSRRRFDRAFVDSPLTIALVASRR